MRPSPHTWKVNVLVSGPAQHLGEPVIVQRPPVAYAGVGWLGLGYTLIALFEGEDGGACGGVRLQVNGAFAAGCKIRIIVLTEDGWIGTAALCAFTMGISWVIKICS